MQKILKAPTLIGIRKAVLEYSFENFTNLDKKKNGKVHNRTLPFWGMLHSSTVLFLLVYYFITAFSNV